MAGNRKGVRPVRFRQNQPTWIIHDPLERLRQPQSRITGPNLCGQGDPRNIHRLSGGLGSTKWVKNVQRREFQFRQYLVEALLAASKARARSWAAQWKHRERESVERLTLSSRQAIRTEALTQIRTRLWTGQLPIRKRRHQPFSGEVGGNSGLPPGSPAGGPGASSETSLRQMRGQ